MPGYSITFARSARRELQKLPSDIAGRIFERIEALTQEPRPHGCKKLKGSSSLWRIRVGEYRVVYEIDDARELVDITVVRHRRDAYR